MLFLGTTAILNGGHAVMAILSALLCFIIAHSTWVRKMDSDAFRLWTIAFAGTAVLELVHGLASLLAPDITSVWVPWTWAVSRTNLVAMIVLAWATGRAHTAWSRVKPRVAIWFVIMGMACLPVFGHVGTVVYTQIGVVHRPFDAFLALAYAGLIALFMLRPVDTRLLPANIWVFLIPGTAAHVVAAIWSQQSLDVGFYVAHGLKLLEYGAWAAVSCRWVRRHSPAGAALEQRIGRLEAVGDGILRDLQQTNRT